MEDVIAQYTGADEDSRLTRQYIAQLEYDTTMHKLATYLTVGTKVCEVGAATGRYSLAFDELGCEVTAVELAPEQVEMLRSKALEQQRCLLIYQGNACDLSFIESGSQDVCVILGPLYHLKTSQERVQAITEAKRILKSGGILAVAYISRFFVAGLFAHKFPHLMTPAVLNELHQSGTVSDPTAPDFFNVGYFSSPTEIETLLAKQGLSIISHSATDSFNRYIATGVNNFSPSQYQTWLDYHLQCCDEPSLLGASNHGLVVSQV
ncbi:class I SAM-dependent methyltransferase [Vibrio sp. SCSIO 43136]|uniref:class I SAM-dependent methyltransferase n=1 Tax=Vibrio sp. SCSIO 43136 TaxID=2819101 RepID=UPI002075AC1B|nr:class I SAM-dependent methyltransferase [Vibrio sp. SCSIO 43136]USD64281.1 methyltransferase domain-containing protein [Vibrio sp. SCSIO 43136]